jgi:hypothetical protein
MSATKAVENMYMALLFTGAGGAPASDDIKTEDEFAITTEDGVPLKLG